MVIIDALAIEKDHHHGKWKIKDVCICTDDGIYRKILINCQSFAVKSSAVNEVSLIKKALKKRWDFKVVWHCDWGCKIMELQYN